MSLAEELRPIDDRSFESFVAEARARIPRYCPGWTDLNDNDLGMALVQVFAWLAEQQVFRMGRVPDLNYIKFLEMVGVSLRPAMPAVAEVTFPLRAGFERPFVTIPMGTRIAARTQDGSGPIVFETERALTALEARLDRVQTGSGTALIDVSAANDALDEVFDAFGPTARDGAVLALGFASDQPFPAVELDLAVWVAGDDGATVVRCGDATAGRAPATIIWESWDGANWRRLTALSDETAAFTRSGHVRLRGPQAGQIAQSGLGRVPEPRYWIRARLEDGGYTNAPRLTAIRTNTARVTQKQTVEGEVLGATNATLDQVLTLQRTPVIAGSLVLEIDEGDGFGGWSEVADFFGSGPEDPHYVLNRRNGEVLFGDGDEGRLPVGNPLNPGANAIARRYAYGGGVRGNVAAGALASLRTPIQGVDSGAVSNLFAAEGGREEETLDEAIARARRDLSAHDRAVTPADYEALALQSGPVARAKALPLVHPDFPGVEVPGVSSVVILPDIPGDPAPMPTPALLRQVCAYLDPRRLLTAELYIMAPRYLDVTVSAALYLENDADLAEAVTGAVEGLEGYFHPLTGGSDGQGWPFGGDVYYSRVASLLLAPGVRRLGEVRITLARDAYPPCADAPVPAGALLRSGAHQVVAFYEGDGDE